MINLDNHGKVYARELIALSLSVMIIISARNSATFINNIFIAKSGISALASVALVSSLFNVCAMFCSGVLSVTSIFVANARGNEKQSDLPAILVNSLAVATLLGIIFSLILKSSGILFTQIIPQNINSAIITEYSHSLLYGIIPLLWHITLQQYLIGHQRTRIVIAVTVMSLPIQAFLGYVFAFGKYGMPVLGVYGVGLAYSMTNWLIFISLGMGAIYLTNIKFIGTFSKINWHQLIKIVNVGWWIGFMLAMEALALFGFVTIMAMFGQLILASYYVAIQCLTLTSILAMGIAQATSVLIGKRYGEGNTPGIKSNVHFAIILGAVVMIPVVVIYVFAPSQLLRLLQWDMPSSPMIHLTSTMLGVLAIYQFSDTIRLILTGALRGLQITMQPMVIVVGSYFIIGLPFAYLSVVYLHQGPIFALSCLTVSALFSSVLIYKYLNNVLNGVSNKEAIPVQV